MTVQFVPLPEYTSTLAAAVLLLPTAKPYTDVWLTTRGGGPRYVATIHGLRVTHTDRHLCARANSPLA